MLKISSFLLASLLAATPLAWASPITYDVTVNTSSLAGTTGSLDFQFNPGPLVTQAASLQVLEFTSDGTLVVNSLPSPQLTGDVSGDLSSVVTFDNGTQYNDYFEDFTYGTASLPSACFPTPLALSRPSPRIRPMASPQR